jgi:hypothetical protein
MREDFIKNSSDRLDEGPFLPPPGNQGLETFNAFQVRGLPSGKVTVIGPTYNDIVGIPEAMRSWKNSLSSNCDLDVQYLRKKNEGFLRVLLNLDRTDLVSSSRREKHIVFGAEPFHGFAHLGDSIVTIYCLTQHKAVDFSTEPQGLLDSCPYLQNKAIG